MTSPLVSYMLPCYRGYYAGRLIAEIVKKNSDPYELLLWLNLNDEVLEGQIKALIQDGHPIKIIGKTPENIGMAAFRPLIESTKGEYLIQLEDDVLFVNRNASTVAREILGRRPNIGMLSAEVWQDELTNGGHPAPTPENYKCICPKDQLFEGPVDGGFTVYPRRFIHLLMEAPFTKYFGLGAFIHSKINSIGAKAYKCRRMRIFHLIGAYYHSAFPGAVEFEIAKYMAIGKGNIADIYKGQLKTVPPKEYVERKIRAIEEFHNVF